MNNKKGFTLIELLAVIVILAIIALIVTPVVSNIVVNARVAANARSVEGHIRNIELAIISRAFRGETTGDTDAFDTITDGSVIESSLSKPDNDNVTCASYKIEHGKVISALECKASDNSWDKKYSYTASEGAVVFEFKGTFVASTSTDTHKGIVYMDPTNPKAVCNSSSEVTTTPSGCKKFYIYDDSGDTYKMIMDRNTTAKIAWANKTDYIAAGGTEADWNASKHNTQGPVTVMAKLASDTSGWDATGTARLITANEIAKIVGANLDTTIKFDSSKTYSESVSNTTTNSSWFYLDGGRNSAPTTYSSSNGWQKQYATSTGASNYAWLFDYTNGCTSYGCNTANSSANGYWTSDAVSGATRNAWYVSFSGDLSDIDADIRFIFGIRPVLEIPKSLLEG